ncbi:NHL repeat family protein [Lysobacter antibioticus]|uniref:NHL repeat family protein n=2 Tax=Lysobacter antibioticus TaxID=84531 RepID=A0A0S2F805_LYSAN|nr:NHL repeat family protein [Lysobacter antibioticus]
MMNSRLVAAVLATVLLSACATRPVLESETRTTSAGPTGVRIVPERFVSAESPEDELDSLATWPTENGATWLIASAKSTHRLAVYDADSGQRLRTVGAKGQAPGQFKRPNGLTVFGDHLFVVERDNHRVQVLRLPDFAPVGSFGDVELRSPYGVWINELAPGELEAYITDSFMYGDKYDQVPALTELDQRVRRYKIHFDDGDAMRSEYVGSFGDTTEDAALRVVESIAGDPANDRLLIADEDDRHLSTLREYTLAGRYTGRRLPDRSFDAQAEGVALWSCPNGAGYWIAVDQLMPRTIFHVFDRVTLVPQGSFSGEVTAHTDGIALHAAGTTAFPTGALYAVHDDRSVTAFDLGDIARSLQLQSGCLN